jgi:hypothetical protein
MARPEMTHVNNVRGINAPLNQQVSHGVQELDRATLLPIACEPNSESLLSLPAELGASIWSCFADHSDHLVMVDAMHHCFFKKHLQTGATVLHVGRATQPNAIDFAYPIKAYVMQSDNSIFIVCGVTTDSLVG